MKLKENETIPNSEFFIMVDGSPVRKILSNFLQIKRLFYLVYLVLIHQFVQPSIYPAMLITMINTKQKV